MDRRRSNSDADAPAIGVSHNVRAPRQQVGKLSRPNTPCLRTLSRRSLGSELRDVLLIGVPHFLPNLIEFCGALMRAGLAPFRCMLLYKDYAYPAFDSSVRALRKMGIHVAPLDEVVTVVERGFAEVRGDRAQRILIIEDGGHVVEEIHRAHLDEAALVIGAIEQTEKGTRKAVRLGPRLSVPVLDVARSEIKRVHEPPFVARSFFQSLQAMLPEYSLAGREITVIGFGHVGVAISQEAYRLGMSVTVHDVDRRKLARARTHGFRPVDDLRAALDRAWLVVGATGETSVGADTLNCLRHGTFLASASSGSTEIDVHALHAFASTTRDRGPTTTFALEPDGREVHLLAGGHPLNFQGAAGVCNEIIDLVLCAMFASALDLATHPARVRGIHPVDAIVDEYRVEELFYLVHGAR